MMEVCLACEVCLLKGLSRPPGTVNRSEEGLPFPYHAAAAAALRARIAAAFDTRVQKKTGLHLRRVVIQPSGSVCFAFSPPPPSPPPPSPPPRHAFVCPKSCICTQNRPWASAARARWKKVIFFVQQHPSLLFSAKITAILKTNSRHQNVAIQVWMKVLAWRAFPSVQQDSTKSKTNISPPVSKCTSLSAGVLAPPHALIGVKGAVQRWGPVGRVHPCATSCSASLRRSGCSGGPQPQEGGHAGQCARTCRHDGAARCRG